MSLQLKSISQWEAGEIALVTLIAFLFVLLFAMLFCIGRYGYIYHQLKKQEGKPLIDGDGPYNSTARPNYQPDSTDDDDDDDDDDDSDDDHYDEEHNINMANKDIRKSFGAQPLMSHNKHKLMRYNTNTTNQSGSTESDTATNNISSDTNEDDEDSDDNTQTNLKRNRNQNQYNVHNNDNSDDEEDSDVRNRYKPSTQHQMRQYNNYIQHGQHGQHGGGYQGGYGNEMMQQHHHKLSAQPPPPPGAIYNDRQSKSGTITTMTSLTSITATEPLNDRTSNKQNLATNYANQHPINDHLQKYGASYTPSDKQPQQY